MRQWYPPGLSAFNRDPHRPRRSRDDLGGGVFVEGVEVFALLLGDRFALGHADFADLVLVRLAAAFLGLHRVLQKHARRWGFYFEAEGAVLVDRYQHADDLTLE